MARKKKVQVEAKNSLNYTGSVNIKVLRNGKEVSKRTIKNNGKWPLFYFFALCLSGEWKTAATYRPTSLEIYSLGDAGDPVPEDIFSSDWLKCVQGTIMASTTTDPNYIAEMVGDNVESGYTTIKFVVPYSQIINRDKANLICLRCNAQQDEHDVCAYIVIKDESDESLLGSIIPSTYSNREDYTLFIEWKLVIKN